MTDVAMKDYGSGFLALILAGILMMVLGIGLMISTARSPDGVSLVERPALEPAPVFAPRSMDQGSVAPTIPLSTGRKG
jgi:hypothetical protein